MFYYVLKYVLLGPLLRLVFRPEVEGAEHVPRSGPAILASNHLAVLDSFLLPLVLPRRITFPAKREYFTEPGLKGRLKKAFFTAAGQVPIDRSSANAAQAALDTCVRLLEEDNLIGIYPEGTRSPDGNLYKGKTGVARIALRSEAPVLPVAMFGTDRANPIGSRLPRPAKVRIKIGPPLDFSRYEGLAGDRFVERSVTDEVMYELMELSGQRYVDVYAQKVKDEMAARQGGAVPLWRADEPAPDPDRRPDTKAG